MKSKQNIKNKPKSGAVKLTNLLEESMDLQ